MDVVSTHVPIHLAVCISGCHFDKYTESKTSTIISKKLSVVFSTKCQYLKSFKGISKRKKERKMDVLSFKNNTWLKYQRKNVDHNRCWLPETHAPSKLIRITFSDIMKLCIKFCNIQKYEKIAKPRYE